MTKQRAAIIKAMRDNCGHFTAEEMTGEAQTVELTFGKPHNNSWDYYLTIAADNTKLYIRIDK